MPLVGQPPQQAHHLALGARVEARRGLVEEEQAGAGDELGADRHSLALPAREALDGDVAAGGQAERVQRVQHAFVPLLGRGVAGQA